MTKPLVPRQIRYMGWRPDPPDKNDKLMARAPLKSTPAKVDLRESGLLPEVWDQGAVGSCTAHAIAAAFAYDLAKQGKTVITPSRLFIYYGEREIEGTIPVDAGGTLRDGMKVISRLGAPDEKLWPYDLSALAQKPSDLAYNDASHRQCISYVKVPKTLKGIQDSLARGFPVTAGFTVYESFNTEQVARSGQAPVPQDGEQALGGHAVLIVGYKKRGPASAELVIRNSWGTSWGDQGYFTTTDKFLAATGLRDTWTVETTE